MYNVSVVITFYNDHDVIQDALSSVFLQHAGSLFQITEVILIDDGSAVPFSGYTGVVPSGIEFKVFRKDNGGVANARNFGLSKLSKPHFIALLDADDKWLEDKTYLMVSEMIKESAIISGCLSQSHKFFWSELNSTSIEISFRTQLLTNCFLTSTVIMDATQIPQDELYFPDDSWLADEGDLFNRILYRGKGILFNRVLIDYDSGKAPFGEAGVSSKLWGMQMGELRNYVLLLRRRHISRFTFFYLVLYSNLKFVRRLVISNFKKLTRGYQ